MSFNIILSREAIKTLDKVERNLEKRMRDAMRLLQSDPKKQGKAVKSMPGLFSLRIGDWRILYTVSNDNLTVYVLAVRPRGNAYRKL